ncbi:formate dehydrogenase subunit gamma [Ramlibacter alkalitolerans]|uniref:Formate dehydrogenase subunit gamma n=1 Tax=Ramlibacter alkalitolerans TaxID=2039631 RepID=A0ABS1JPT1_9BURK|nr:formate dehydrogenase subunit gamma [Ramlibacter alkalitolerans]MBL0426280.1 formate dehydrogenase subunit gamma [Ramlibacter alkalitolerans]
MSRFLDVLAAGALTLALASGALAQSTTSTPAGSGSTATPGGGAPAANKVVPDDIPPGQGAGVPGIQGQNIFDVKPEVKRDASSEAGYMEQNNGQRNAVQPGNNAPMWRGVQAGRQGYSSLPMSQAPEAGVLIQEPVQYPGSRMTTAGQAWRETRNNWILPYGGSLLLIVAVALAIFYFVKGPLGHSTVDSGPMRIERFTPFERAAHWVNAIAFVVLGISGIIMAFGKFFLLPVVGLTLFGYFTYLLKNLHNFFGPLFAVSLAVIIVTFIRDNFPQKGDLRWLLRLGGLLSGNELPSHRFNAMEKVVFWVGTLLLGVIVVGSGLVMDKLIPNLLYDRQTMQVTNMVHATAAALMLVVLFVHIYVGTVGFKGAYTAMRHGYVNEPWAQEHHAYWYEDIRAGKIPVQRSKPLVVVDDTQTVRTV